MRVLIQMHERIRMLVGAPKQGNSVYSVPLALYAEITQRSRIHFYEISITRKSCT